MTIARRATSASRMAVVSPVSRATLASVDSVRANSTLAPWSRATTAECRERLLTTPLPRHQHAACPEQLWARRELIVAALRRVATW